jgi:site-specific recombinase XerD
MTPALHEALYEHKIRQEELGYDSEYVFTYRGEQIRYETKDSLKTVLRKADLKNVTLHVLRHTFASQLALVGVPLRDIQELMGHQSFQTTLQYAHLSEEHVKKQVMRLPFAKGSEKSMAH